MGRVLEVAPGIHLIEESYVNCFVIEGDDGLTLVDTGLPGHWKPIGECLAHLGRAPEDIRAIVLTHAHFDHVGTAKRWQAEHGVPIWAHVEEKSLAAHPYSYAHEKPRAAYPIRHPRALRILGAMALRGALLVKGVEQVRALEPGVELDVPGSPRTIFTPGHTWGHCALHVPDRDAVITGDSLVTLDPYTARTGPRIVAGAATADSAAALGSLDALRLTGATHVLPGHGVPWHRGIDAAVSLAVEAGAA